MDDTVMDDTIKNIREAVRSAYKIGDQPLNSSSDRYLVPQLEPDFTIFQPDPELRDRLIEHNLDEALRYLQICASIRADFSATAKDYIDTKLKSEEFFRLDDIHEDEVESGLYALPYQEADDERSGISLALEEATKQQALADATLHGMADEAEYAPDPGLSKSQGTPSMTSFVNNSGDLASFSSVVEPKVTAWSHATWIARYKVALDYEGWKYSRSTAAITVAQLKAKLSTAARKAEYLKKDIDFRTRRREVSRQLAYTQLMEHSRPYSVVNYKARLDTLKEAFRANLTRLIHRVFALKDSVSLLYRLPRDFNDPVRGRILDDVSTYLERLQESVIKYRKRERTFIFSLSLKRALATNYNLLVTSGGASLHFRSEDTKGLSGLLRGIAFEYVGQSREDCAPLLVTVQFPPSVTGNIKPTRSTKSIVFGRVMPISSGLDLKPQQSEAVWNGDPYGDWVISASSALDPEHVNGCETYLFTSLTSKWV